MSWEKSDGVAVALSLEALMEFEDVSGFLPWHDQIRKWAKQTLIFLHFA